MPPVFDLKNTMKEEMEMSRAKKIYKFVGVVQPPYIEWNPNTSKTILIDHVDFF